MDEKLYLYSVTKIFNKGDFNEVCALKRVDLKFCAGENVIISGHNGSGKSTLLNLIDGRIAPTNGKIFVDGRDITDLSIHKRAKFVYRLFQDSTHGVIPLGTIRENMDIALGRNSARSWFKPALCRGNDDFFSEVMGAYRPELADKLDKKVFTLSPGERQALILALLKLQTNSSSQILLADEPTASLDPTLSEKCIAIISEYASRGWLCLTITHDSKIIKEHGGRLIDFKNGSVFSDTDRKEKNGGYVK
ncbi:ATP-binding cassette domain-containing protein [Desulfotignum phosphitoxidans]|uniref:ABC-type transport system, ATPase component n=1 Tax=Desulfotignum phosphitoxidans DSM 13687 TaxID=1286635 RepID=S0FQ29_9BACT|nr:ATP-binding cassette domain-containing protein [Desulfotignum phosphitoxidans]EMS77173.1 ABC-type transport system, ATPase component [Desulfotignum phosphitoxidans DSM 13687]